MKSFLFLVITSSLNPFVLCSKTSAEAKSEEPPWFQPLRGAMTSKISAAYDHRHQQDPAFPVWHPAGQALIGSQGNRIGELVKLSADGHSGLAEGRTIDTFDSGIKSSNFTVHVHTYSDELDQWVPVGDPIVNTRSDGKERYYVMDFVMDKDGFGYLAISELFFMRPDEAQIGKIQIWTPETTNGNKGTTKWSKFPHDLSYGDNTSGFGNSIALSSNNTIAVGAPLAEAQDSDSQGSIFLYRRSIEDTDDRWEQWGPPLFSPIPFFGTFVKISLDGSVVVGVGGDLDEEETPFCQVQAFQFDESAQEWLQMGQIFPSKDENVDVFLCDSLDLSSDGQTLVIGGTEKIDYIDGGHVRVYSFDKKTEQWVQKGQDLDTVEKRHSYWYSFGTTQQISADGNLVVLGLYEMDKSEQDVSESILTYQYSSSQKKWIAQGSPLHGQEGSSEAISMSDDGELLVVAAYGGAESMGVVNTYRKFDTEEAFESAEVLQIDK